MQQSKANVDELVADIRQKSQEAATNGLIDKEKYVIPPHLHDLQEADLPETQRGLVISEIAQFRERAAKREREKMRDNVRDNPPLVPGAPSGPKVREWGKPQGQTQAPSPQQPGRGPVGAPQGYGKGAQGYSKPVGFVKAEDGGAAMGAMGDERQLAGKTMKTDEELEAERKEGRRREEDVSFRDVSAFSQWEERGVLTQKFVHSVSVGTNLENGLASRLLSGRSPDKQRRRRQKTVMLWK
jgi:RNA-binding protein 25